MRIAQLLVVPAVAVEVVEVVELTATERGESGFGSSGVL
jgi:dUTPase